MRFLPSDKYNVAWFKLAECVARGERERALGVYRLLAHSFDDAAFARQVEGDILLAFDDIGEALERYKEAAQLYHQTKRTLETAAMYEHIFTLDHNKQDYLPILIDLYKELAIESKVATYLHMLCAVALHNQDTERAGDCITQLIPLTTTQEVLDLYYQLLEILYKKQPIPSTQALNHMHTVIDMLIQSDDQKSLQQFLATLELRNQAYYVEAARYLNT